MPALDWHGATGAHISTFPGARQHLGPVATPCSMAFELWLHPSVKAPAGQAVHQFTVRDRPGASQPPALAMVPARLE